MSAERIVLSPPALPRLSAALPVFPRITALGNLAKKIKPRFLRAWLPGPGAAVTPLGQEGCLINDFSPATWGKALVTTCCSFQPTTNNLDRKPSLLEFSSINKGGPGAATWPRCTNSSSKCQTLADWQETTIYYFFKSLTQLTTTTPGQT